MRRSAREGNVLLNLRRIPTLWAHLSYTLSMWLLQVRVSLKITPRCLWIFTCGIGMPAIDTEGCGATPFNPLPQIIICSLFSALNSIPQVSAQDEAAVTSRDRATVVVVMFFPGRVRCRIVSKYGTIVRHRFLQVINEDQKQERAEHRSLGDARY